MKNILLLLLVSTCLLHSCRAQLPDSFNLDFELWDDTDARITHIGLEPPFEVEGRVERRLINWGTFSGDRNLSTTDATSGQYALVLNNWYGGGEDYAVWGEDGYAFRNTCDDCGHSIDFKPEAIKLDYKLFTLISIADSLRGLVDVYMTRYDTVRDKRDTIGQAHIRLIETDQTYHGLDLPIQYTDGTAQPDTMILFFSLRNYGRQVDNNCHVCQYFYIDNIRFDLTTDTQDINGTGSLEKSIKVYPNPFGSEVQVQNLSAAVRNVGVYDSLGRRIDNLRLYPHQNIHYNSDQLNTGIYYLRDGAQSYKLLKYGL